MKKVPLVLLAFLFACTKKNDLPHQLPDRHPDKLESCSFGINQFNHVLRQSTGNIKRPTGNTSVTNGGAVIFLDFDGHYVSNTAWNWNGDFNCDPAILSTHEMQRIFDRVTEDFRPFHVTITTEESVFRLANPLKRMRVVITETWQWYGQTGGVSFLNSFTTGDDTPCFVFSSLLGYNEKKIAEAVSHEVGHTLGLRHQAFFDNGCTLLTEYYAGKGTGEVSWAPIMGNAYSRNLSTWHNGTTSNGCNTAQDETTIIASILGFVNDDHSNTSNSGTSFSQSAEGIIHSPGDIDFFSINVGSISTLKAIPFNIGDNTGANLHLLIKIYNGRTLIATVTNPDKLDIETSLAPGKYTISVESVENAFASRYGMLGKYTLLLQ
jgi:hypothetical protein